MILSLRVPPNLTSMTGNSSPPTPKFPNSTTAPSALRTKASVTPTATPAQTMVSPRISWFLNVWAVLTLSVPIAMKP